MSNIIRIPYTGTVPGADTTEYTLFDSLVQLGKGAIARQDISRYALSLGNPGIGTLKAYASASDVTPTTQFYTRRVMPNITGRVNDIEIAVATHHNIKITWTNGGVAQTNWYVGQSLLCGDDVVPGNGYDDTTNIVNGSMAHSVTTTGSPIQVGPQGNVIAKITWAATGAPVGVFSLQFTWDGTTWTTIPDAADAFTNPSGAAGDIVCYWRQMRPFRRVRIVYTSTSAGAANASLNCAVVTW